MRLQGGFIQCKFIRCSAASDEKEVVLLSKTQGYKHPSPIEAQLRAVTGKQEFLWRPLWHCQSCRNFLSVTGKGKEAPRVGVSFPVTPLVSSVFLPYLSIFLFLCMCVYACVWCMHTCAFMQINMTCAGRKRILISLSTIFPGHSLSLKLERSVSALQSLRLHTRVGYTWV